jgi:hypothetical protein
MYKFKDSGTQSKINPFIYQNLQPSIILKFKFITNLVIKDMRFKVASFNYLVSRYSEIDVANLITILLYSNTNINGSVAKISK